LELAVMMIKLRQKFSILFVGNERPKKLSLASSYRLTVIINSFSYNFVVHLHCAIFSNDCIEIIFADETESSIEGRNAETVRIFIDKTGKAS